MQLVYQSTAMSETPLQVKSTPPDCFDIVECAIGDTILPASNTSLIVISDVTGKLMLAVRLNVLVTRFTVQGCL